MMNMGGAGLDGDSDYSAVQDDDSDCRSKQATSRVSRRKTSRGASKAQHATGKETETEREKK